MLTDEQKAIAFQVANEVYNCEFKDDYPSGARLLEFAAGFLAALPKPEPFGYYENGRWSVSTDGGPDKWRVRNKYVGALYAIPPNQTADIDRLKDEIEKCEYSNDGLESALSEVRQQLSSAQAENAALKEQVAEINASNGNAVAEWLVGKETITQQAEQLASSQARIAELEKEAREPFAWMSDSTKAIVYNHAKKSAPKTYQEFDKPLYLHSPQAIPEGWKLVRTGPKPFKRISIEAPNGYSAVVDSVARNPENILYMLAEAMLAAAPSPEGEK